jgi:hypothetical protein
MPSESYKVFNSLGRDRFDEMIHEQDAAESVPVIPNRAITIRMDAFKVEGIDAVARSVGLNRQDFLIMLIEAALGDAIEGFSHGFGDNFTDFHPEHTAISFVGQLEDLTPNASVYLNGLLAKSMGLEGENI